MKHIELKGARDKAVLYLGNWPRGDRKRFAPPFIHGDICIGDARVWLGEVPYKDIRRLKRWCEIILKERNK